MPVEVKKMEFDVGGLIQMLENRTGVLQRREHFQRQKVLCLRSEKWPFNWHSIENLKLVNCPRGRHNSPLRCTCDLFW